MKVVIAGAGPAGLAAAEALLSEDPTLKVEIRTLGHIVGGRACSWRLPDGRTEEHGQHVVLGFYAEMRALLARSGVDEATATFSNRGRLICWEDRDEAAHTMHFGSSSLRSLADGLAYSGWTAAEKAGFAEMFVRGMPEVIAGVPESLDDVCLTAWCLGHGMPASCAATNAFRASREAQLNWPGEISAYAQLRAVRAAGRDYATSEALFPAGGMSEIFWEPIVARIEALGGTLRRWSAVDGVRRDGDTLRGLTFRAPLPHDPAHPWTNIYPPLAAEVEDVPVDAAILAVPPGVFGGILAADPELAGLAAFAGVPQITSIAPLGMHVWHKNAVTVRHQTVVFGLLPPLAFVLDNKPIYAQYRDDDRYGACLHFVGQESGYEDLTDEEMLVRSLASARKVPGFEGMDREGVLDFKVIRNRAPHKRYFNAEPGSLQFKPHCKTPIEGLFLAGDWVRNELDFPCMEAAVRSGRQAAREVLALLDARRATRSGRAA